MTTFLANELSKTVQNRLQDFLNKDVASLKSGLDSISREIDPTEQPADASHLRNIAELLLKSCEDCRRVEEDLAAHPGSITLLQEAFRCETAPWFSQSWMANRARTKPTGFPGDCMMLATLYDEQAPTRGLGGYIDAFILNLPLAVAVRERMKTAREFLKREVASCEGDLRILDVASGPCREFVNWTAKPRNGRVFVTCLDTDPESLDFVRRNVAPTAAGLEQMRLERYNAFRTKSAKATERHFGRFDILYSVGLADYIPDESLTAMLEGWRLSVDDGGVMYVAFKDCREYDKTPYQWHLDWHFFQRTEEDCRQLLAAAGFDLATVVTERDASGIIMHFFCPVGVAASRIRVDAAETAMGAPKSHTASGTRAVPEAV